MKSLNRVMLIGHVAADPDLKQTKNGHVVVSFPLATNRMMVDEDGQKREFTDFHRVVAWSKLGEICSKNLSKGMGIYVDGRLFNRSFENKDGMRQFRTEINLETLNILTWKKSKDDDLNSEDDDVEDVVSALPEKAMV